MFSPHSNELKTAVLHRWITKIMLSKEIALELSEWSTNHFDISLINHFTLGLDELKVLMTVKK